MFTGKTAKRVKSFDDACSVGPSRTDACSERDDPDLTVANRSIGFVMIVADRF
jgi:hypothetical protein